MTDAGSRDLDAVHRWFLQRGLPMVLGRRVRGRGLVQRAAPAIGVAGAAVALHDVAIELTRGDIDTAVVARLAAVCVLLLTGVAAVVTDSVAATTRRAAAWMVLAVFVFGLPLAQYSWGRWAFESVLIILASAWLTYAGIGSIASWALRFSWTQFGALGTLMGRALPLLMLTVMVYFTNEIWQLSARLSGTRFWQTTAFLSAVAVAFMVTTIRDEVGELRASRSAERDAASGTPLQKPVEQARPELSRSERVNVVAILVLAQAIQVIFFAAGVFIFFMALGAIAVPDELELLWSGEESCAVGEPPCRAVVLGVPLPVSQTAVHTALFVAVLSGLYFTVSSSVDPIYRQRFFDPLVADVAANLAARDAYLEGNRADE
jgi:hypothetical protein